MTTITRERLLKIQQWSETYGAGSNVMLPAEEAEELARIALASLEAEPVAYNQVQRYMMKDIIVRKMGGNLAGEKLVMDDIHAVTMALIDAGFRTAQPASEREQIRREHAEWSDATFGDVGPIGPLKHLSKEALEAAAEPDDLSEWADMQFLLWDAQRRAGITDEQITRAMVEKLAVNKQREWPAPKDGEPRLHIKEQPAPVVPESISVRQAIYALESADCVTTIAQAYKMGWNACRAAMLQSKYRDLSQPVDPQISEYEKIMQRAGWVMVPVEPTDEMIEAAMNCEDVLFNSDESFCVQFGNIYEAMLAAAPQQEQR
ncbi:DUF550 domain-containing protein [Salmonella enterica]|uniref:DUF550 domain-containing protein n=1 Tax=Salmonella enterica TaxID=28901 RepID=UPI0014038668|nr:DUF550 domain-containing protein [Salmonella enterica]